MPPDPLAASKYMGSDMPLLGPSMKANLRSSDDLQCRFLWFMNQLLICFWSNPVHSIFSYDSGEDFRKNDIRVKPDLDALGALGDTGWYCIRAILWAADYEMPKTVTALPDAEFNEAGVILSCAASLRWDDGKRATFYCSFLTNLTMDIGVLGSNGYLRVHDFVIPFQENVGPFYVTANTKFAELSIGIEPAPTEHKIYTDLPQEALMVKEFSGLVSGIKEHGSGTEKKWQTISRKTQILVDAVKASIEKGFEPIEVVF